MSREEMWHSYFTDQFSEPDPWSYGTSQYEQDKYNRQIRVIDQHCESVDSVLEIGCAEGVHSEMLLDAFPEAELTGVDLSEQAIERARDRVDTDRATFVAADAVEHVPDLTERFDAVVWSESIAFIGDCLTTPKLYGYLGQVLRRVAPDGVLVMANLIDGDGETGLLSHPDVMGTYRSMLSSHGALVHYADHTGYKAEEDEAMRYEIWAFEPADA